MEPGRRSDVDLLDFILFSLCVWQGNRNVLHICPLLLCRFVSLTSFPLFTSVKPPQKKKNTKNRKKKKKPELVQKLLEVGDRDRASKLSRQARQICPQLSRLRAAPRLVFPCPVSPWVLRQLRAEVKAALRALPFIRRAPQFIISVESTTVCWEKTHSQRRFFLQRTFLGKR